MESFASKVPGTERSAFTLRFFDRRLEAEFRDRFADDALPTFRKILPAILLIWLGFGLLDHRITDPEGLWAVRLIRFGLIAPILAGIIALAFGRRDWFAKYWQPALAVGFAAILFAVISMHGFIRQSSQQHGSAAVGLVVVGGYTLVMLRFAYATVIAFLGTIYVAIVWGYSYGAERFIFDTVDTGLIWVLLANVIGTVACYQLERFRRDKFLQRRLLEVERQRSDDLLLNVLPARIATRLKHGDLGIVDSFDQVTVLFGDLVGFTALAERLSPRELVGSLNVLFTEFDAIAHRNGLEKIKTIGDAYMVVGGVPEPRRDHARACAEMALAMCSAVDRWRTLHGYQVDIRIGLHTGPVVAGIIGTTKFSYDVWGDTVNVASRMQTHGIGGAIQVSETTHALLADDYWLESRGEVVVKGKGKMSTYLLRGRAGDRESTEPFPKAVGGPG